MEQVQYTVADLLRVMARLRDPQTGCPWDIRQDFKTIVPSTLEECYELAQAIEYEDYPHVAEELGDVLFQVIFYAQLGSEQGLFSFNTIVATLVEKLVRRHPHVFADGAIEGVVSRRATVDEIKQNWEAIKQVEREGKAQPGILADVPVALPALPRAQKLQKRAALVNFDWSDSGAVLAKLQEEIDELRHAIAAQSEGEIAEEMGDVLFSCVNLARHLGLDAESSLRNASGKFEQRFADMEVIAAADNTTLAEMDQEQLDALWEQAKRGGGRLW
ncbi:MAG: nucleoside triphosphate pyrophosphohydrolase [Gammaproteobacteria bacterium]|nr:MAG: nucleoside triphosphate pyrophosphohydrolase [Gammaproteobacteria bacterium]RLA61181.1 MAG: nucleoside triphosphate pyrophosphohydrolase [Gammaproteobacteria bacterium]